MSSVQLANSCYLTYHAIVEQINIYFKFFNCLKNGSLLIMIQMLVLSNPILDNVVENYIT